MKLVGAGQDWRLPASAALFHRLEPADHCFDPRSNLFVFLQESCTLGGQCVLALLQGDVFTLQLVAYLNQRVNALLEPLKLLIKHCIVVVGHGCNIEPTASRINRLSRGPLCA